MNEIFDACRRGDLEAVVNLYKADPSVIDTADTKGFTPLILAVYNNQPELVKFLLEKGADINKQDAAGNTALMGVSFKGYTAIAKMLIEANANINLTNSNGASALIFAAMFGQPQIAEWLLQADANLLLPDSSGKTALDHARLQQNEAMIELIEKYIPADKQNNNSV